MKIEVGTELYYVPHDQRWASPKSVTVTKVGRKWAYLSNRIRFEVADLESSPQALVDNDGGVSGGSVWISKVEHKLSLEGES